VFSFFSVSSVLRQFGKNFNSEVAEKNENTEKIRKH